DALFSLAQQSAGAQVAQMNAHMVPGTWTPGSHLELRDNPQGHKWPEEHTTRLVVLGAISAGVILAVFVMLVAFLRGLLTFPPHLSVVLGFLIAAAVVGVVTGCVLYRMKTRHRRLTPYAPWGGVSESYLADEPEERRRPLASAVSTYSG